MKAILEKIGSEKYLEFALSDKEIKLLLSHRLVTCEMSINGKMYQVAIRALSTREYEEEYAVD